MVILDSRTGLSLIATSMAFGLMMTGLDLVGSCLDHVNYGLRTQGKLFRVVVFSDLY